MLSATTTVSCVSSDQRSVGYAGSWSPAAPYIARYDNDDKVWGWTYAVEEFAKLGVDNITVINGPWVPRLISGKHTFFPVQVKN